MIQILKKLTNKEDLTKEDVTRAIEMIETGNVSNEQIAAFVTALKTKGETSAEIAALANAMKSKAISLEVNHPHLIDTAGTGGDYANTFNISTCAAFVAAGAGAIVAKHGNRKISSSSGSADVLEALGVNILTDKSTATDQLNTIGITFLFAPLFHPAMKVVSPVRKTLGFKTVFNILGPLLNPTNAKRQLIGAYNVPTARKIAEALFLNEMEKALVVTSDVDEISISKETQVYEVSNKGVENYTIAPEDLGFERAGIESLKANSVVQSAEIIQNVLNGEESPRKDVVLLNAGAALYVAGLAHSIENGVKLSESTIESGKALEKLELLRGYENGHS